MLVDVPTLSGNLRRIAQTYPQDVVVCGLLDHCGEAKEREILRRTIGDEQGEVERYGQSGGVGWV